MIRKRNKLVFGVGINDVDYNVYKYEIINAKYERIWSCPFYVKWYSMLRRCYSATCHKKQPTYKGCSTVIEWHHFSKFKAWMETQDWQGKQLDKDILFSGNKLYGPSTCVFIDSKVNSFLTERGGDRGDFPIGVYYNNRDKKYRAQGCSVENGKRKDLGLFISPEEAHKAWLTYKLEQAKILAAEQTDARVAKALIDRYENYGKVLSNEY